jgi:hypothetical protein
MAEIKTPCAGDETERGLWENNRSFSVGSKGYGEPGADTRRFFFLDQMGGPWHLAKERKGSFQVRLYANLYGF